MRRRQFNALDEDGREDGHQRHRDRRGDHITENGRKASQQAGAIAGDDGNRQTEINRAVEQVDRADRRSAGHSSEIVHRENQRGIARIVVYSRSITVHCRTADGVSIMSFSVTSNSFKDGDYLAKDFVLSADFGFGCAGGNKSPHLKWSARRKAPRASPSPVTGIPMRRAGSRRWHWLVVNSYSRRRQRAQRLAPAAPAAPCRKGALMTAPISSRPGYGGPCPPEGDHPHRYLFTSSRLATMLERECGHAGRRGRFQSTFQDVGEKAAIVGLFKR